MEKKVTSAPKRRKLGTEGDFEESRIVVDIPKIIDQIGEKRKENEESGEMPPQRDIRQYVTPKSNDCGTAQPNGDQHMWRMLWMAK